MRLDDAKQIKWPGSIENKMEALVHLWNSSHAAEVWLGNTYYPPAIYTREKLLGRLHSGLKTAKWIWSLEKQGKWPTPPYSNPGSITRTIAGLKRAIKMLKSGQDLSWADIPIKEPEKATGEELETRRG